MHGGYGVFLGLDVGKDGHHAVGLAPDGKRLHDAALPNTETKLRALFDKLGRHGTVLVVVDQPASIVALPVAVARACGDRIRSAGRSALEPRRADPADQDGHVMYVIGNCHGLG